MRPDGGGQVRVADGPVADGLPADLLAAVLSRATTVEEVIAEIAVTRMTERGATRGDDKVSDAAMEDRKKEGYF